MVNLPLKNDFAPVASTVNSAIGIMDGLRQQQKNLSSVVTGINDVTSFFSDDLNKTSNNINNVLNTTASITGKLNKQKQLVNTIQSSSTTSLTTLKTLGTEISQTLDVTKQITSQAQSLDSIVKNGISLGSSSAEIGKQLTSAVGGFSSKAETITSALSQHTEILSGAIAGASKDITGFATNISSNLPDISKLGDVSSLTSAIGPDSFTQIIREGEQVFTEISDTLKGAIDDLKNTITDAISSKLTTPGELSKIVNNLDGVVDQATSGLTSLVPSLDQLGDLSSTMDGITNGLTEQLGAVSTQLTDSFKDQLGQINDITSQLSTIAPDLTGQINNFGSVVSGAVDQIGTIDPLTGIGGVSSLKNISDPTKMLSASIADVSSLSGSLVSASESLKQYASNLPSGDAITELSDKLISVGTSLQNQISNTPEQLMTLATVTENPGPNIGSIESAFIGAGQILTETDIPNITLNVDVNNMTTKLSNQVITLGTTVNSIQRS